MTFAEALTLLYPKGIPTYSYAALETELSVIQRLIFKGGFTPRKEVTRIQPIEYKDFLSRCAPKSKSERQPRNTPENLLPKLRNALGKRRWKATPVLMVELKTSRKMLAKTVELLRQDPGFEEKGNHHKKYRLRDDPSMKAA